ncbi:MAG: glycoside hydrolase family 3 N-terminal domain-containing protein, partial [Lachnospira sp.]|nr:glycoside hydrolase family 3 N-terminal domain-containing protein [Lachnospira sp.]
MMIDLKARPFYLDEEGINWVQTTLDNMTLEEKVGQVFCPVGVTAEEDILNHQILDIGIGGIMYRPGAKEEIYEVHKKIQDMAKIPLLLAANTESGGDGLMYEGTSFGKPMAVAATGNVENAYRMGYVACTEGAAVGLNWSFAPIVDIDMEFHSPITNVRTFGSDIGQIIECASNYMRGADKAGVAVAIKHFPGDGTDERDQHILTSINKLSCEEWNATYGKIYQTLINEGAKTIMVGHIAMPAYVSAFNPEATAKDKLMPATLSKEILTDLLRNKLEFNGLISTDSSSMIGFMAAMPREQTVPMTLAAGADVILFNKNLDEDVSFLIKGLKENLVSEKRLDEAVTRILATKSALNLHKKKKTHTLVPDKAQMKIIGNEQFKEWAKEVADKSVTLIKDTQHLLPISNLKYKRIYMNLISRETDPNQKNIQIGR